MNSVRSRLFLATALAGTLLSFSSQAKDEGHYFYPKNKWVVEHVGEESGLPVCSLSNQLNNGYIVQLAGTKNGLSNLNIDFRQDIFTKDFKYETQYTIPGRESTLVSTKAFKESLLVSDLRKQPEFSSNLLSAATMDVNIRGNEFRMYLTGLSSGLKSYNECLDPGGVIAQQEQQKLAQEKLLGSEPARQDGLAPLPPVNIDESKPEIIADAGEMPEHKKRPDFESRERYTDKIAKQIKEESKEYQPQEAPPLKVNNVAKTDSSANSKSDKIAAKTSGNIAPEKMHDGAIYNVTKPEKPVIADLTSLQDRPTEVQQSEAEMLELAAAKMNAVEPAASNESHDPAPDNHEITSMRDKISELEKQLSVMNSKNKMLDEELKSALQDSQKEQLSVSSGNWNLEMATMKFNEAERQVMRLGRQLQTSRAQCEQEKQQLETMLFDPTLTDQQQLAKLASLEADLEESKSELYRQQRLYEERIKILEGRLSTQ